MRRKTATKKAIEEASKQIKRSAHTHTFAGSLL